jgi:hypothetical protein
MRDRMIDPNLSKDYLAGNAPEEWIPLRSRDFYREHGIALKLRDRAVASSLPRNALVRLTPRWRKQDSNRRSPSRGCRLLLGEEKGPAVDQIVSKDAVLFTGDQWFEPVFLRSRLKVQRAAIASL